MQLRKSLPPFSSWHSSQFGNYGTHDAGHGTYKVQGSSYSTKRTVSYKPHGGTETKIGVGKSPEEAHRIASEHHAARSGAVMKAVDAVKFKTSTVERLLKAVEREPEEEDPAVEQALAEVMAQLPEAKERAEELSLWKFRKSLDDLEPLEAASVARDLTRRASLTPGEERIEKYQTAHALTQAGASVTEVLKAMRPVKLPAALPSLDHSDWESSGKGRGVKSHLVSHGEYEMGHHRGGVSVSYTPKGSSLSQHLGTTNTLEAGARIAHSHSLRR